MQKLIRGKNDLLSVNPELAKEWNVEKNSELKPCDVLPGSHKKVWWKCLKGHEWEALIRDRNAGKLCPYCSNIKLLQGYNDLATVHPEIAKEWNYEKNGELEPNEVKYSANLKVWWKCSEGHEWQAYVFNRSKGVGCPICTNHSVLEGFNDLASTHPRLVNEWNYEKNGRILPTSVTAGSHKRVWWKCKKGHEWESDIKSRANGNNCPFCSNKKTLIGYNDLNTTNPIIAKEWCYKRNDGLKPTDYTSGSQKMVWWKCSKGHEWKASIHSRTSGRGCPYCSNNNVLEGYNDLATTNPDIAKEWDYEKNKKTPEEVMAGSNIQKYWFICPKGHSYATNLLGRKQGTNCPICVMERHTSFPEKSIFYYLNKYIDGVMENYRDSIIGRKEIDIYCPELKFGVEYDGRAWHKDIKRDLAKDSVCVENGITLVRVREKGCCKYSSDSVKIYISPYDIQELKEAILSIFGFLNEKYQLNINADVDIERDRRDIQNLINHSEKDNSVAKYCPQIKQFWNYEKNGKITPEQISHASTKKVYFKCEKGHEWEAVISNFSKHPWCPYCSGRKVLSGFNDLFTTNPELKQFWSRKNTLDPTRIKRGCNSKALWYCPECGGEYDMQVNQKVKTPGCPYCSGHRVLKGYNDLATLVPELVYDWDYEQNSPLKPDEVTRGSNKKVWWRCHTCDHVWKSSVYNRGVLGRGCPECRKKNTITPNSKRVVQLSLDGSVIGEYTSVKEAERKTGIKNIYKACRIQGRTAGGFIWKYV